MACNKYSDENIKNAIDTLFPNKMDNAPLKESIISSLKNKNSPEKLTVFIIYKRSQIFSHWIVPTHHFCVIDKYVWHPGNSKNEILDSLPSSEENFFITEIEELCIHCAPKKMKKFFDNDKKFNFFINNCQRIIGFKSEYVMIHIYHACLFLFLIFKSVWFFLLAIVIFGTVALNEVFLRSNKTTITHCVHIKDV